MASKKNNNQGRGSSSSWLTNNLSLIAVILLAVVMIVSAIMKFLPTDLGLGKILGILQTIAMAIAIGVTLIHSYRAARTKGKKWFIIWIVAAILVVLSYILGLI